MLKSGEKWRDRRKIKKKKRGREKRGRERDRK